MIIAERYELYEAIGQGGMGVVHRATDQQTGQMVAVKELYEQVAANNPVLVERFIREAKALRQLDHPNIVKMLDAIDDRYIVMEYVSGGSLADQLDEPIPVKRTLQIALELADALTRAHHLGIIHRDIKPANVLMADDGTPRLADFGVAHVEHEATVTQGGMIGTAAYMSPEACRGEPLDARSDIWSFGVLLVEMLTGERPFEAETFPAMILAILNEPIPDLTAHGLPDDLVDLLYRMLDKSRDARIPSVRMVGAEVEAILHGLSTASYRRRAIDFATPTAERTLNLPHQTTPFVGREQELAEIGRLLGDESIRLVTILGPGGMGKTRLAIESARAQPGAVFVPLAPLSDPEGIVGAIGEAMGYTFREDAPQREQILALLSNKKLLLVLDNFEHVLAGAGLVADILQHAPGVTVLATSRQRLNLSGETVFSIGGMDFPDWETPADALEYSAVRLFVQSARRTKAGFELEADDLRYVARICRLVHGVPLGILLAAAWVDVLALAEIADEISESFDILETTMQDVPERQRSMQAVFDYSWNLLNAAERDAFAKMAVFRGGFERKAAQAVAGAGLRMLNTLATKSLIARDAVSGRYGVHELLRQYAEAQIDDPDIRKQHAVYYISKLTDANLTGGDSASRQGQLAALDAVEADFENIRAAWHWAVGQGRADLVGAAVEPLAQFCTLRSRFQEGVTLFEQARARWNGDSLLAGRLLLHFLPQPDPSRYQRGLEIARQHDSQPDIALGLNRVGHYRAHRDYNFDVGLPLLEESLALYRDLERPFDVARVLDDIGFALRTSPIPSDGTEQVEEGLAIRRRIGDRVGVANSLRNLGGAAMVRASYPQARPYWSEALEIAREMNDRSSIAWNAVLLAQADAAEGNVERSTQRIDEVLAIADAINAPDIRYMAYISQSLSRAMQGDVAGARKAVKKADAIDMDDTFLGGLRLFAWILVHIGEGHPERAREPFRKALTTAADTSSNMGMTMGVMLAAITEPEAERAAELLGAGIEAGAMEQGSWVQTWPGTDAFINRLREELGQERYEALIEKGKQRDLAAVVAEILAEA